MKTLISVLTFFIVTSSQGAIGPNPDDIHVTDAQKTKNYLNEGLVIGGDRTIDDVIVLDIRYATNSDFERIVIDLDGNKNGEPAVIQRPPYYQVEVSKEYNRAVVTVYGKPKLAFDAKRVKKSFRKSRAIKSVDLFPLIEKNRWTFSLNLKPGKYIEVFELSNPVRVILDIKK